MSNFIKNYSHKLFFIVSFIVSFIPQTVFNQDRANYINLNYILVKLTFTSRINHSNEEINLQLIKEIRERKVDFILTSENEKQIKEAHGTDNLIKEINANLPKDIEINLKHLSAKEKYFADAESLYQRFLENRRGPELEKIKIAIEAGEEFIKIYGDEGKIKEEYREVFQEDFKEIIDYVKKQLAKLKNRIE